MTFDRDPVKCRQQLEAFHPLFENDRITKIGHNLKYDLAILKTHGVEPAGPFFDTMLAHALVEPEHKHGMDLLAESYLEYKTVHLDSLLEDGQGGTRKMEVHDLDQEDTRPSGCQIDEIIARSA